MALIVQKYGGTSVGTLDKIQLVAKKVQHLREAGNDVVVVVSAMSGETDRLVSLAQRLSEKPHPREVDVLLATGEQVSIALLSMALNDCGCKARSYTGSQVHIRTDSVHNKARILGIQHSRMTADLAAGNVVVVAGFQGVDEFGNITTLGRGGSDTTAVAIAAALKADECQIYSDVDGVYTADPAIVKDARRMTEITFEEMLELSSLGVKVMQNRAVEFAGKYNVPVRVLSTFEDGTGTLITHDEKRFAISPVIGLASSRHEAKLTILGIPDEPLMAAKILTPLSEAHIEVDMVGHTMNKGDLADVSFTVHRQDYQKTYNILRALASDLKAEGIVGNDKVGKLSLVGVGLRSHASIASQMFQTLGALGVNIQLVATSEIKVSVVVDEKYVDMGVRALHDAFQLGLHK